MAYNRYREAGKPTSLEMTDIPGVRHNPYIKSVDGETNSRNGSPAKRFASGKAAEIFESDIVKVNESKIRNQIIFSNNQGVMGPFLDIEKSRPAPKAPNFPLGSSAYKMQFSPAKKRDELPAKLIAKPKFESISPSGGLRHISNQDALIRGHYLSNSIDYSSQKKSMALLNPRVTKARQVNFDNVGDDFRFKKNLTTNADRIMSKPSSYVQTPNGRGSSKYEEIRKAAMNNSFNGIPNSPAKPDGGNYTYDTGVNQENLNHDNMARYNSSQTSPTNGRNYGENAAMMTRPRMLEPSGSYQTANIQKSLGMSPSVYKSPGAGKDSNAAYVRSSMKIGQAASVSNFNDPTYHRTKNLNNYGFDVLTGVRKESPNRAL